MEAKEKKSKPLMFSARIVRQGNGGRINMPKALIGKDAVILVFVDEELIQST